jgi:hypothetical protein
MPRQADELFLVLPQGRDPVRIAVIQLPRQVQKLLPMSAVCDAKDFEIGHGSSEKTSS